MRFLSLVAFLLAFSVLSPPVFAQAKLSPEQRQEIKSRLQNMTPEQREALAGKRKEKWQNMSEDERKSVKRKAHKRFDRMSPEQKSHLRERFKAAQ